MLGPCSSCRRHVRTDERVCPFCGSAVAGLAVKSGVTQRMSRAAIVALGTIAVAATGCPKENGGGSETIVQPYGAPPQPQPPDAGPAPSSSSSQ
ncbi:MAG: hypothetical protein ACXVEF_29720 [Polyangiales bacterium]